MRRRILFFAPLALLGLLVFVTLGGAIVRLLWNWLLPPLFGFPQVTFWQALGLLALCRVLFGGFRVGGPRYTSRMTPEERERIRQRMRERWGWGQPPYGSAPPAP